VTADGFIPPFVTGVFFGSFQSLWAMGLILLKVTPGIFFGGGSRRRGGRPEQARRGSRGINVIFAFLGFVAMFG